MFARSVIRIAFSELPTSHDILLNTYTAHAEQNLHKSGDRRPLNYCLHDIQLWYAISVHNPQLFRLRRMKWNEAPAKMAS